jgi:hypothetical protein
MKKKTRSVGMVAISYWKFPIRAETSTHTAYREDANLSVSLRVSPGDLDVNPCKNTWEDAVGAKGLEWGCHALT